MAARVIDLHSRRGHAPDLIALTCGRVRDGRSRTGLSASEFAAALQPLLGWAPKPGLIRAWETDVEPPASVVMACDLLSQRHAVTAPPSHLGFEEPRRDDLRPPPPDLAAHDGDALVIPCRTVDGRITWVSIPRRMFLAGGLGAAALTAIAKAADPGASDALQALRTASGGVADPTPIEHLEQLRRVLVDSDNLLGPGSVLPAVHSQIQLIGQLRTGRAGADRRALLAMQAQYAEFAGWLHQDARDFQGARFWLDRALEWSHAATDHELATYVIVRKSQLAGDMGDAGDAIDLAAAASNMAAKGSRLQATAATYGAHGHALTGDQATALRSIDVAREMAASARTDSLWATWLDASYIEVQRGRCLSILGDPEQAAAVFQQAITGLPPTFHRDRGVYLAREALAHALARHPEQAADVGLRAVAIARDTRSGRVIDGLAQVDNALSPWAAVPAVAGFRDSLTSIIPAERTG